MSDFTTTYQTLFDIQLRDLTVIQEIEIRLKTIKNGSQIYNRKLQIREIEENMNERSKELKKLDELIFFQGSKTIADLKTKTL